MHILPILICLSTSAGLDQCESAIVYERNEQAQVLYVMPVSSILGRLPLVPVGATGTIPFAMRREAADFRLECCTPGQDRAKGYILVRTSTYLYNTDKSVREFHSCTYRYVPVHTSTYFQQDKLFSDPPRKSQEK